MLKTTSFHHEHEIRKDISNDIDYSQDFIKIKSENGLETVHYSSLLYSVPKEYEYILQKELKETNEKKEAGLKKLRDFAKRENLLCPSEDTLLMFLRWGKYDLQKSERKLKNYINERRTAAKMLTKVDKDRFLELIDEMVFGLLPYRDRKGRAIFFSRPSPNIDSFTEEEIVCGFKSFVIFLGSIPLNAVTGFVYLAESKNCSLYIQYCLLKHVFKLIKSALSIPARISKVEVLNERYYCHVCYKAARPFTPANIVKRVEFNGQGYQKVHNKYDPAILPDVFDGTLGPLNSECYRTAFLEFIDQLLEEHELEN